MHAGRPLPSSGIHSKAGNTSQASLPGKFCQVLLTANAAKTYYHARAALTCLQWPVTFSN